jgi:hypothetical protein
MPVAHTCNPSYSRRQRSGISWFEVSLGKEFTPITKKKGLVEWLKV